MLSDNLIVEYLGYKSAKVKSIKAQKYNLAAEWRDLERQSSLKIYSQLCPDRDFVSYTDCENLIDNYCVETYNCGTYDANRLLKTINRIKLLKDLGI